MNDTFQPILGSTDWNEEWKRLQISRKRIDDASVWDGRAQTFPVKHGSQSEYVREFLKLAGISPRDTVLDMGCGTGALATPLAQAGCKVLACDFSRGMLDKMAQDQAALGVRGVEARLMSWADDWDKHGVSKGSVDVALASRSIATSDLQESLLKLDRVARRRVCITLPCGPSPRIDSGLVRAAGLDVRIGQDFLYAFNILAANGINPQISYIESERIDCFESREAALDAYVGIVRGAMEGVCSAKKLDSVSDNLRPWLDEHLVESSGEFKLDKPRIITWAFIAWDKH